MQGQFTSVFFFALDSDCVIVSNEKTSRIFCVLKINHDKAYNVALKFKLTKVKFKMVLILGWFYNKKSFGCKFLVE